MTGSKIHVTRMQSLRAHCTVEWNIRVNYYTHKSIRVYCSTRLVMESNAFLTSKRTATALTGSKVRQQKQWSPAIESCLLAL